jgi:hypothetical protein
VEKARRGGLERDRGEKENGRYLLSVEIDSSG